jgi:hypothetical protein
MADREPSRVCIYIAAVTNALSTAGYRLPFEDNGWP